MTHAHKQMKQTKIKLLKNIKHIFKYAAYSRSQPDQELPPHP